MVRIKPPSPKDLEVIVFYGRCRVVHLYCTLMAEFTHFFEHFTFDKTDYSERGKHMKKYIRVVVAVELVTVGAKIEPIESATEYCNF